MFTPHYGAQRFCFRRHLSYPGRISNLLPSSNYLPRTPTHFVRPFTDSKKHNNDTKAFDESVTSVKLKDNDDGEEFMCDEEPHMLSPELGYGYNPLILGSRLHGGKYEIVRKLGWGGNASVWLAKICNENHWPSYVSIKVLTVNATAGIVSDSLFEFNALKKVMSTNTMHPGYKHCINLRDSFPTYSEHGPHICLVSDVLSENLVKLRLSQPGEVFTVPVVKRITKQTLLALDYLHRECRVVHTDVKPDNILVSLEGSDEVIHAYLSQNPSATYEPRIEPDLSPHPIVTVKSQPLPNFNLNYTLSNLNVRLIDYSQAVCADPGLEVEAQPVLLRAPEVILGHTWSTPVDIWSVGCLVFEYLVGTPLFQLVESSSVSFTDTHLARILEHIGPFPKSFLDGCSRRAEYFDEEGSLLRTKELFPRSVEVCLRAYNFVDESDIGPAAAFIRRCLSVDPSMRPDALTLLDDEWLRDM